MPKRQNAMVLGFKDPETVIAPATKKEDVEDVEDVEKEDVEKEDVEDVEKEDVEKDDVEKEDVEKEDACDEDEDSSMLQTTPSTVQDQQQQEPQHDEGAKISIDRPFIVLTETKLIMDYVCLTSHCSSA